MDPKSTSPQFRSKVSTVGPPSIIVRIQVGGQAVQEYRLLGTTTFGRDETCDIAIEHDYVSRKHLEVSFENGCWWARDLGSTNGTYLDENRVDRVPLTAPVRLRLGPPGPILSFEVEVRRPVQNEPHAAGADLSNYIEHYFGAGNRPAGERTMIIRRAFEQVQSRQRKKYWAIIAVVAALFVAAGGYGLYLHLATRNQRQLAEQMFYEMKSLQIEIATSEEANMKANGGKRVDELAKSRERRKSLEQNYERFMNEIGFYTKNLKDDEKLIFRVARVFGESELRMPPDFVAEVKTYIGRWKSTNRFREAVSLAINRNYHREVTTAMLAENLPPQFFYIALQESNFDTLAVGRPTYMGIAKGAWQFIPKTAMDYGLKIGPEFELARPDPADDRHNFEKATDAAARYIKFLYSTEAQASGLLVMASYNWGEDKVIRLIRTLPENPRERNFWELRSKYRNEIPQETYDYVLSIFSAAVIGENPRLFGFDFDSPLAHLASGGSQ